MKSHQAKTRENTRIWPAPLPATGLALCCGILAAAMSAAERGPPGGNLGDLSIEELMNESVTSVSKKEQRLGDVPAAIFVLSNDDLRRSGATSVAEVLRLVPGLQVAAIDSSDWAISARGFNSQFSNKLLVTIDGRTVYSPIFSGVYWEAQQMFLDDVDRIEVIRGPGATVWGANAVNGVISIISKSARDTQGSLVYAGGGDVQRVLGGARQGGKLGENSYYRAYALYQLNDDFKQADGRPANDGWNLLKGGFRVDHYTRDGGQLTWQADGYTGTLTDRSGDLSGYNALARWTISGPDRSGYEAQVYFDHTYRNDFLGASSLDTFDLSWQHTFGWGDRHDVIWGVDYRFSDTRVIRANSPAITILQPQVRLNLFSAFVQDAVKIVPDRLTLTLGTKVEHNDFTGIEIQPSVRLAFKPAPKQTVWAAVSRAVRTPSESEGKNIETFISGPPAVGPGGGLYLPVSGGNPQLRSEVLRAYELGYRIEFNHRFSVDLAGFYNDYDRLVDQRPTGFFPAVPVGIMTVAPVNALRGESHGGEVVLNLAATASWRVSASYSLLRLRVHGASTGAPHALEINAPTHQIVLRSAYDFTRDLSLDAQIRQVDKVQAVPAYVAADLRLSYRPSDRVEWSLVGQNLFDDRHPEQASVLSAPTIEMPRRFYTKITLRF